VKEVGEAWTGRSGPSGGDDGRVNRAIPGCSGDDQEDSVVPGVVVTTEQCAPRGGEGRVDVAVPRCGGDGDNNGGGRGGGGIVPTVEQEQDDLVPGSGGEGPVDGAVPGRDDNVEAVGMVAAWTQWHRRRCGTFWQPNGVQVKILRLWFKGRAAGGFIGGQQ
jgi:hypothetical protein